MAHPRTTPFQTELRMARMAKRSHIPMHEFVRIRSDAIKKAAKDGKWPMYSTAMTLADVSMAAEDVYLGTKRSEEAREFWRKLAALPGARAICECGHTGDGPQSQHTASEAGTPGHGRCTHCDCQKFRWAKWLITRTGRHRRVKP